MVSFFSLSKKNGKENFLNALATRIEIVGGFCIISLGLNRNNAIKYS